MTHRGPTLGEPTGGSPSPSTTAVRSFKHRRGRITDGQQAALRTLSPSLGVATTDEPLDLDAVFARSAPVTLDIGFGMGEVTVAMAAADPASDILAVDVHTPGAGALLRALDDARLTNVRVIVADAVTVLTQMVAEQSLAEVRLYFPDPWPKARHHKRRLVSPSFARLVATRLRPGGRWHIATDWTPYAAHALAVLAAEDLLVTPAGPLSERPPWRPVSRYERIGLARGHQISDIVAHRRFDDVH